MKYAIVSWIDQAILWLEEVRSNLGDAVGERVVRISPEEPVEKDGSGSSRIDDAFFRDCGTAIWRLKKRLAAFSANSDPKSLESQVSSVLDSFQRLGVEIRDLTGVHYDAGLNLRVLGFETSAQMIKDRIVETVKPGVYRDGRPIQIPEVIVETSTSGANTGDFSEANM